MNSNPSEFRAGWKVVLASALGVGIGVSGAPFYTLGIFLKPLAAEFGWNRAQIAASTLFLTFGYTLASPLVGRWSDRTDVRKIALISLLGLAIGFLGMTLINGAIASFYLGLSVLALAGCGTSPLIWSHAVNTWFDRSRGLALGITLAGGGLAGIVAPRAVDTLIQSYGWQAGYIGLALYAVVVVFPVVFLFFRERKAAPPVNADSAKADAVRLTSGMTLREAVRSRRFWQLGFGIVSVSAAITAIVVHLVPLLTDSGMSRVQAANIAGVLGFAILFGRLIVGWLVDRFHAPYVAAFFLTIPAVGYGLLVAAHGNGMCLILATFMFGVSGGAEVDLLAYLTSRFFGLRAYGVIYGCLLLPFGFGAGIGPLMMGRVYDVSGTYMPALYAGAFACCAGAFLIGTLGRYPHSFEPKAPVSVSRR